MEDIKVSVIIPVYNAGKYLEKCLDSVTRQTLKDIEIICVDDGSTDNTPEILSRFAEKDARLKVFNQKNLFAGAARNRGIEEARGKYLAFWDGDDFFHLSALETLYKKAEKEKADICLCSAYVYDNETKSCAVDETILKKRYLPREEVFSIETAPDYIFNMTARAPWNKIIRADFIKENKIEFQNLRNSNDTYFSMICMYYAKRITYVMTPLIYYRVNNSESITGKASSDPLCTFKAYAKIYTEITEKGISEKALQSFYNRLFNGLIRGIVIQGEDKSLKAAYDNVKNEAFEFFDIKNHLYDEYCYFKSDFEDMKFIEEHTLAEFLMYKYRKENAKNLFYKQKAEKTLKIRLARRIARLLPANSELYEKGKKLLHFK